MSINKFENYSSENTIDVNLVKFFQSYRYTIGREFSDKMIEMLSSTPKSIEIAMALYNNQTRSIMKQRVIHLLYIPKRIRKFEKRNILVYNEKFFLYKMKVLLMMRSFYAIGYLKLKDTFDFVSFCENSLCYTYVQEEIESLIKSRKDACIRNNDKRHINLLKDTIIPKDIYKHIIASYL